MQMQEVAAVAVTNRALLALTSAAIALPGISPPVLADTQPEKARIGYRLSNYSESDLDKKDVLTGSNKRYDIDTHQFQLVAPFGENYSASFDYQYETMSGASPLGVAADTEGNPILIMSGASIKESRTDASGSLTRYFDLGQVSLSTGFSKEDDYNANNASISGDYHINNKLTTLSGGLGFSNDTVEPTQQTGFERVTKEDKDSITGFLGFTQVLSKFDTVQTSISITDQSGYLSDPYKNDTRPDARQQIAWLIKYRRYLVSQEAALHVNYRYYDDDWGIESHTLDFSWHKNIGDHVQLVPSVRYYSQSQADFYESTGSGIIATENSDSKNYQSTDYRLSPFGALTLGLKLVVKDSDWKIALGYERYDSSGSMALKNVEVENPALVDFTVLSLGLDYSF